MLYEHTHQGLMELKLFGMAKSLEEQRTQPTMQALCFEERMGLMVDRESTERKNKRLSILLRNAKLRQDACVEAIDYSHARCLEQSRMAALISCDFVHQACRKGLSVRYLRTSRVLEDLRIAHADGSYGKLLMQLAKIDLLILDDFGLEQLSAIDRKDILEIIEDRHKRKSTLITAQLGIKHWHDYIGEPTIADAILDRVLNNAHKLELSGLSMRVSKGIDLS